MKVVPLRPNPPVLPMVRVPVTLKFQVNTPRAMPRGMKGVVSDVYGQHYVSIMFDF